MAVLAARIAGWLAPPPRAGLTAAYLAAYIALDWASTIFPSADLGLAPWNPATGVSLAYLLRVGARGWPWLWVAGAAAELMLRDGVVPLHSALAIGVLLAAGYTGAALLVKRWGLDPDFRRLRDAVVFLPTVMMVTSLIAAGYVAIYWKTGLVGVADLPSAILQYWVGDLIGIMVVTPVLLVLTRRVHEPLVGTKIELAFQALALIAAMVVVFGSSLDNELRHFYVLFVPLIWIAIRHGLPGTVIAMLGLQLALLVALQVAGHDAAVFTEFQSLMAVLAAMGLILGVTVSERQDSEARLTAQEQALRTVLATAPDAILTLDGDSRVVGCNPAAERMFGTTVGAIAGRRLTSLVDTAPGTRAHVQPAVMTATASDGRRFPVEITTGEASGPSTLTVAVLRDITARVKIERALRAKQRELDRTLRLAAASETASALAHELNQPLAAIANYVRAARLLLEQGTDPAAMTSAMDHAVAEVARAGDVMRRLREFFQSGTLRQEALEVGVLVEGAVEGVHAQLQRHDVRLAIEYPPALPRVLADPVQIATVLHNLLVNAIEALRTRPAHGDGRRIVVRAREHGTKQVMIAVIDNGPGVPASVVPQLFSPFASSKPEGMGLGLAISRSMIEAHGGELRHEPLPEGTSFTITLPVAPRPS